MFSASAIRPRHSRVLCCDTGCNTRTVGRAKARGSARGWPLPSGAGVMAGEPPDACAAGVLQVTRCCSAAVYRHAHDAPTGGCAGIKWQGFPDSPLASHLHLCSATPVLPLHTELIVAAPAGREPFGGVGFSAAILSGVSFCIWHAG